MASLEATGPDDAVELLAGALEALVALDAEANERLESVRGRLLELVTRVRDADGRLGRLMEVDEQGREQSRARTQALADAAMRDPLTGLYNRRAFEVLAQEAAEAIALRGEHMGVLFVDLDHFKRINDELGHAAGDAVLMEVGRLLARRSRRADVVARWGGEEFVLALPGCSLPDALRIAEDLRGSLEELDLPELPEGWAITASLGVASDGLNAEAAMEELQALIEQADERVYEAKRAGRNRVVPDPGLGLAKVA
ncbi:MAG: GGDEF domain-containing protein [Myxococcota bacterium]|nr:GGDEF domain-containing protein [Myxococcota bacterium]